MGAHLSNPKVSIMIPVYNNSAFLEDCIRSALLQSYPNIEIILIDDCSTEPEVRTILSRYASHSQISISYNAQNIGISRTQNLGICAATGDIIAFLDCDDLLTPDAIEVSLSYWTEDTRYSFSNRIHIDEQGHHIRKVYCEYPLHDIFAEQLDSRMYTSHFKMIHREVFEKIGIFNPDYDSAQDYDLALRAAFHFPRSAFIHVPFYIYYYRIHDRQTTSLILERQTTQASVISNQAKLRKDIEQGRFDRFITILIVSSEGKWTLLRSIRALKRTLRIPHEIVILENGSSRSAIRFMRNFIEVLDGVRVIYSRRPLGISEARKAALSYCHQDGYLMTLDQEIEVTPGWIEELLVRAEESDKIGSVSCRVAFPNQTLFFTGGGEIIYNRRLIPLFHHQGQSARDLATMERQNVSWNPASATLYKFPYQVPEGYSHGYDDLAYSRVLRNIGLQVLNAPNAQVIHHHIYFYPNRMHKEMHQIQAQIHPQRLLRSAAQFLYEHHLLLEDPHLFTINRLNSAELSDQQYEDILHHTFLSPN